MLLEMIERGSGVLRDGCIMLDCQFDHCPSDCGCKMAGCYCVAGGCGGNTPCGIDW